MLRVRKNDERGYFDHGWLKTYHTFSFGDYYDPKFLGFRSLRVINEDWVEAGQGFGKHPHKDMEIITYVLEGDLEHQDSTGGGGVIRPGKIQRMTAGRGVVHSEFNHSNERDVHLLQIWIHPDERSLDPEYEEKEFPEEDRRGTLRVIASPDARDDSLTIHSDAVVYASILEKGETLSHTLDEERGAFIQVARGKISVNGQEADQGDGVSIEDERSIEIRAEDDAEFLLFDLK